MKLDSLKPCEAPQREGKEPGNIILPLRKITMRSLSKAQLKLDLAELERLMDVEKKAIVDAQVNLERLRGAANYVQSNLANMGEGTVKPDGQA